MIKKMLAGLAIGVMMLGMSGMASASSIQYTFSDKDFLSGASWGTMTISTLDADTLGVQYQAANVTIIPGGSQVTGFGFNFDFMPDTVTNPSPILPYEWVELNNLNAIPVPANADEFIPQLKKTDFLYGATEGNDNNFTVPGIKPGETDTFFLNFQGTSFLATSFDLGSFINVTGIRLQSLTGLGNTTSLFLAGKEPAAPVPEPATMLLFGTGLAGLAGVVRRKKK